MNNIFNTYESDLRNSFDSLFENFDKNKPLYGRSTFLNEHYIEGMQKCYPLFCTKKGFYLQNDQIIANVGKNVFNKSLHVAKLLLTSWNRFFYMYRDENGNSYLIYTKKGFDKLFQFWIENPSHNDVNDIKDDYIGAISIFRNQSFSNSSSFITIFLRSSPVPKSKAWVCLFDDDKYIYDIPNVNAVYKNVFIRALIFDLIKKLRYNISEVCNMSTFDWERWSKAKFSEQETDYYLQNSRKLSDALYYLDHDIYISQTFTNYLKNNYESFINDQKDICSYLWPKEFSYTKDENNIIHHNYAFAKILSLYNGITKRYLGIAGAFGMSTDYYEHNDTFIKTMENAGNALISDLKYFNSIKKDNELVFCTTLLFLNIMYKPQTTPNKYGIKEISATLLFYILYEAYNRDYEDKYIINIFITIVLIGNEFLFKKLLNAVRSESVSIELGRSITPWSWKNESIDYCYKEIVYEYAKEFQNCLSKLSFKEDIIGTSLTSEVNQKVRYLISNLEYDGNHTFIGTEKLRKSYIEKIYFKIDLYFSGELKKFGYIFM